MKEFPDRLLVVDVEATCWKHSPPPGQQSEIIEIGVCIVDLNAAIPAAALSGKRSLLVRPARSKVSPFCTRLTTLTQEQLETGALFAQACGVLEDEYGSAQHPWISWGDYDRRMFETQCRDFDVRYPFSDRHLNLKAVFAGLNPQKRPVGLSRALTMLGLTFEGTHHRGHDDAWNVGRILCRLLESHEHSLLASFP